MEERRSIRKHKKESIVHKMAGIVFIAVLTLFLVINVIMPDREFSDKENRSLTQSPAITLRTIANGKYMEEFESWQSDQFAFRQFWVTLKTKISYIEGERESNGVYRGKNHCLLEEIKVPDEESLEENLEAINTFQMTYEDIPMYVCLVPNAANVWEEKLPALAATRDQDKQLALAKGKLNETINWVDMKKNLEKHKDQEIYYHTDHHWTTLGAYYGYQVFAQAAGLNTEKIEAMKPYAATAEFNGTLSSVSGYESGYEEPIYFYYSEEMPEVVVHYVEQQTKTSTLYDRSKLNEKDKYAMFLGGNYPLIDIRTTAESEEVLLVLKDSYANCFLPFLTDGYREIVVVDPRYYFGNVNNIMKNYGITQVLFLYNMNTFVEDNNIRGVLENEE